MLWWGLALVLPVLFFDPVRQTFLLGQVNIILALMIVADLTMDLPLPRGILVGLAAAIKVTPIILIPYLFLTRQGRAGLRAIASFVAAALLAVACNASTSWSYWTHYIRDPQRAGMLSWIGNQGILGATERMLGHTVTTPTTFVIVVTVGVRRPRDRRRAPTAGPRRSSACSWWRPPSRWPVPVSWSHHFIWMVLLVAWLALAEDRPRAGEWWALAVAVLLWAAPVLVGAARAVGPLRRPGLAAPPGQCLCAALHRAVARGGVPRLPVRPWQRPLRLGPQGDGAVGRRLLSRVTRPGPGRARRRG